MAIMEIKTAIKFLQLKYFLESKNKEIGKYYNMEVQTTNESERIIAEWFWALIYNLHTGMGSEKKGKVIFCVLPTSKSISTILQYINERLLFVALRKYAGSWSRHRCALTAPQGRKGLPRSAAAPGGDARFAVPD